MKRSVRLAAKAHNIAIVLLLLSATGLGVIAIATAFFPASERAIYGLVTVFVALLGITFVIMVATGFHIAIVDALGRIEHREKNSTPDESRREATPNV